MRRLLLLAGCVAIIASVSVAVFAQTRPAAGPVVYEGARLVLGSATPSLESWLSCQSPQPASRLLRLPERIGSRPLPAVRVIDMRHELADGHRRLISRALMGR